MSSDCIFCKIVDNQMPSTRVYEDDDTVAFMDIGPVSKGHVLVIPRTHYNPLMETPDNVLHSLISVAKKVACAQQSALDADGINLTQANGSISGQVVPHIHFHIIPRYKDSPMAANWHPTKYDNDQEMEQYAARIREAL